VLTNLAGNFFYNLRWSPQPLGTVEKVVLWWRSLLFGFLGNLNPCEVQLLRLSKKPDEQARTLQFWAFSTRPLGCAPFSNQCAFITGYRCFIFSISG